MCLSKKTRPEYCSGSLHPCNVIIFSSGGSVPSDMISCVLDYFEYQIKILNILVSTGCDKEHKVLQRQNNIKIMNFNSKQGSQERYT